MPSSTPETNFVRLFTDGFERLKIPYMVTGSVAAMLYGQTRLTHDVDIVANVDTTKSLLLAGVFRAPDFYCPPPEAINVEGARELRGHFNIIHVDSGYKADVYLVGTDPLHDWGLARASRVEFAGGTLWLAPAAYVIIRKLEYFREGGSEKHLRDIRMMLDTSGSKIADDELRQLIQTRNLEAEWLRAQSVQL